MYIDWILILLNLFHQHLQVSLRAFYSKKENTYILKQLCVAESNEMQNYTKSVFTVNR